MERRPKTNSRSAIHHRPQRRMALLVAISRRGCEVLRGPPSRCLSGTEEWRSVRPGRRMRWAIQRKHYAAAQDEVNALLADLRASGPARLQTPKNAGSRSVPKRTYIGIPVCQDRAVSKEGCYAEGRSRKQRAAESGVAPTRRIAEYSRRPDRGNLSRSRRAGEADAATA
jgi:hypothetical protein